MTFAGTAIAGVEVVRLERREDPRGFFARAWSAEAFGARGLATAFVQTSYSWNRRRGTLRGMHYQVAPREEAKLVCCVRGSLQDVVVDMRPGSPTHRHWLAVRLDGDGLEALYVPPGVAHGFLTLSDDTLVHYQISENHSPAHARGLRWDDPTIGIVWSEPPAVISDRDRSWPLLGARPP